MIIVIPPGKPMIDEMDAGYYSAPVMWDEDEWASPTPCDLEWTVRKISEFEVLGRLDTQCRVCQRKWTVVWDPWRRGGRGHALWIHS